MSENMSKQSEAVNADESDRFFVLLCEIRAACGDNGERTQDELVKHIAALAADAARKQGTINIISNALSFAESECTRFRSRVGELENENRRLQGENAELLAALQGVKTELGSGWRTTPQILRAIDMVDAALKDSPAAAGAGDRIDVDALANFIRGVDGNHRLGAGALAERICEWLATHSPAAAGTVDQGGIDEGLDTAARIVRRLAQKQAEQGNLNIKYALLDAEDGIRALMNRPTAANADSSVVARIIVEGKTWRMDYLSLPEGTHNLYLRGVYLPAQDDRPTSAYSSQKQVIDGLVWAVADKSDRTVSMLFDTPAQANAFVASVQADRPAAKGTKDQKGGA